MILWVAYISIRMITLKQKKDNDNREKNKITLPLRLQAYERMCLFLERVRPKSLLVRIGQTEENAAALRAALVRQIREELQHNFSQQVYISQEGWKRIHSATEELLTRINHSAEEVKDNDKSQFLVKKILEKESQSPYDSIEDCLTFLSKEAKTLM